jgi:glycosyltransferase involved in cell wall biosynthesis
MQHAIERASSLSSEEVDRYRQAARERVRRLYSWEAVTDLYENLFFKLHKGEDPLSIQWNPV